MGALLYTYFFVFSECLDGEVTCFEDFVPDVNGRLNTSQLSQLSGLLKQLFYFENNRKDSILYDIRKIHKMISQSKSHINVRYKLVFEIYFSSIWVHASIVTCLKFCKHSGPISVCKQGIMASQLKLSHYRAWHIKVTMTMYVHTTAERAEHCWQITLKDFELIFFLHNSLFYHLPPTVPEDVQTPILIEWFNHYDSNGNGHIQFNHAEETAFHSHLSQFTSCKHFLDHVSEEIDMNNSGAVTREEWLDFFSRYTSGMSPLIISHD